MIIKLITNSSAGKTNKFSAHFPWSSHWRIMSNMFATVVTILGFFSSLVSGQTELCPKGPNTIGDCGCDGQIWVADGCHEVIIIFTEIFVSSLFLGILLWQFQIRRRWWCWGMSVEVWRRWDAADWPKTGRFLAMCSWWQPCWSHLSWKIQHSVRVSGWGWGLSYWRLWVWWTVESQQ